MVTTVGIACLHVTTQAATVTTTSLVASVAACGPTAVGAAVAVGSAPIKQHTHTHTLTHMCITHKLAPQLLHVRQKQTV